MDEPAFTSWRAAAETVDADLAAIERDAVEAIRIAAADAADEAAADRRLVLVLSGVAAVLAVTISALVALSITRPLARLTAQATKAAVDLPNVVESVLLTPAGHEIEVPAVEQVDVRGGGEIEQVAAALNAVQNTAVELAVEQARMRRNVADTFVNLGRRNQNLIGRQLEYLTRLEQDETDPDTLDHLFHLDHLATRARRNAESLLVLAGLEPPRTWDRPVAVAEVLRGALGEVEHYERVGFGRIEDASLVGSAVAPVTHLLAELVENALSFSPPKERVGLVGRWVGPVYMIAVVDRGIGMTERDMELANRRLAGEDPTAVSSSKYLGHHVAGELARRLGVEVRLEAGRSGGLVARVMLPAALMVEPAPASARDAGTTTVEEDVVREALAATVTDAPIDPVLPVPAAPVAPAPATPAVAAEPVPAVGAEPGGVLVAEAGNVHPLPAGSGLARRRPGASMPVTEVVRGFDDSGDGAVTDAPRTAEQVRSMLSSFSAGVQRGRDRVDRGGEGEP
jgi:signal transduction histidine kinase